MKIVCDCGNDEDFKTKIIKDYCSDYPYGWGIEGFEIICNKCDNKFDVDENGVHLR